MSAPLPMASTRKHGSGESIDPATIAEVVRGAMLDSIMQDETPPHGAGLWPRAVKVTACMILLGTLWHAGKLAGWN